MYYSPLEQFEPIPYFFPFKLGLFYIFGTNVTYILILLLVIFFFINGSLWPIFTINKINENFYNNSFIINSSDKTLSFIKLITLPFNFIVYFYKNIIFSLFFNNFNSLFNTISTKISILLINYKLNLFKSLTNYSIIDNFKFMYNYLKEQKLNNGNINLLASYNYFFAKKVHNISVNNYFLYFLRIYFFFTFFFKKLVSTIYNLILIVFYNLVLDTTVSTFSPDNLKKSLKYFPFFLTMFMFILLVNTLGLIPYSSTATAYVTVTLSLTLIIIIGTYYSVFTLHGIKFFNLFMPQGCPFFLLFLLIPIEFVSYIFRVVSLSARLFANMVAGHCLLAVLASFGWGMYNCNDSMTILLANIPILAVFILYFLETSIAMVQALVFTILSCMYMDNAVNLSH